MEQAQAAGTISNRMIGKTSEGGGFEERPEENGMSNLVTCREYLG